MNNDKQIKTMWVLAALVGMTLAAAAPDAVAEEPPNDNAAVNVANFSFSPAEVIIAAGDTVTWTWVSGTHNVQTADGATTWCSTRNSGTCDKVFDAPGTFAYRCGIHPSMQGTVTVEGEAPVVTIDAPVDGASVDGLLTIAGTAAHSSGITNVDVQVDDGPFASATGTSVWTFDFDTTSVANGGHTVTARARASDGSSATTVIEVNVANPAVIDLVALELTTRNGNTGPARLELMVLNNGNADVSLTRVLFEYRYEGAWHEIGTVVASLTAGVEQQVAISWSEALAVGSFEVRATVDAANTTAETNEANNQAQASVAFWTDAVPGLLLA